jgi:hypothetical protein
MIIYARLCHPVGSPILVEKIINRGHRVNRQKQHFVDNPKFLFARLTVTGFGYIFLSLAFYLSHTYEFDFEQLEGCVLDCGWSDAKRGATACPGRGGDDSACESAGMDDLSPGAGTASRRSSSPFRKGPAGSTNGGLLGDLNATLMRKPGARRGAFFETIDCPALPAEPCQYAEWKKCRVGPDYDVELHGHFYSTPHSLIREVPEARLTAGTTELFHKGKRVASHARSALRNRHTTIAEHMRSGH